MTDKIEYTVVLNGDQYDHEAFLETVADFNGAKVTGQASGPPETPSCD